MPRSLPDCSTHNSRPALACLAGLACLLASCSSGRVEEAGSSAAPAGDVRPAQAAAQRGPTIRVLAPESHPLTAVERLKTRHEANTGVHVEITKRARMQDVLTEVDQELESKRGTYDLVLVPNRALGRLVANGYVRSLEWYLGDRTSPEGTRFVPEKDLFPGWWRATSWYRGKPYGYPFHARVMSLWYRSDLSDDEEADAFYRKYRHPMNASTRWDEYEHMAEFVHQPESGRYGAVVVGAPEDALWYHWTQYALGFGAKILDARAPDEYGDIVVNSPEAVRATEFYVKLLRFSPPDAWKYTEEDALRAFQEGRAATGLMWHDLAPRVEDRRQSKLPGRFGYTGMPSAGGKRVTLLETDIFVIPESATHPREAFELMQWALSHEVQLTQTLNGGFSPRPSVYENRAVKRAMPLHVWILPNLIEGAVPTTMIPEADQIARVMSAELSRVVRGEIAPKAGLDRMARRLEQVLKGKAKLRYPPDQPRASAVISPQSPSAGPTVSFGARRAP
jgi:multiple sugar transport system substrate-binding protein